MTFEAEREFLFPYLMSHLKAEFAEFEELENWKNRLGKLVDKCHRVAGQIVQNLRVSAGSCYQPTRSGATGLFWDLPVFIYRFLLANYRRLEALHEAEREVEVVPYQGDLWQLDAPSLWGGPLAMGTEEEMRRCKEVVLSEIKTKICLQGVGEITDEVRDLKEQSGKLHAALTTMIERGEFKGTCSICEGWFG